MTWNEKSREKWKKKQSNLDKKGNYKAMTYTSTMTCILVFTHAILLFYNMLFPLQFYAVCICKMSSLTSIKAGHDGCESVGLEMPTRLLFS